MKIGARRILSLVAMGVILVLVALGFRYDAGHQVDEMKDLMTAQGRSLADVIAESSTHGMALYNSLVSVLPDSLARMPQELGPGRMIRALGAGRGLQYVVIQDGRGIQVSSTDKINFPLPSQDPTVRPLAEGEPYVSREFVSTLGPVLEISRVVQMVGRSRVLLRVGLDATLLEQMREDSRRRTLMRGTFLIAAAVLFSSLLLAWQRQAVLDRDVERVTNELREKEEEVRRAEKLAAMGNLAAGVAHQIRNPLNSIHMISQLLGRRDDVTGAARDQVRHITDESGRIEGIVQQFLDFSKPREPVISGFDLDVTVRETASVQAAANGSTAITVAAGTKPCAIETDQGFVIEILENLLRNASDAMDGAGRVEIALRNDGDEVEIAVSDDGPGVAEEDRQRIFDLYYTTRPEGTGLGLALAAQMAGALGGSLRLARGPGLDGRGARFVLRLPRRTPTDRRTK